MCRSRKKNDQDQPVGAIDLPCEKPPTPTRLHLISSLTLRFLQSAQYRPAASIRALTDSNEKPLIPTSCDKATAAGTT